MHEKKMVETNDELFLSMLVRKHNSDKSESLVRNGRGGIHHKIY